MKDTIKKMTFTLALGASLVLSTPALMKAEAKTYKDVPSTSLYYKNVDTVTKLGVMSGTGTKFSPKTQVTKSTMAGSVWKAMSKKGLDKKTKKVKRVKYKDVTKNTSNRTYIEKVQLAGVMSGTGTKFNPNVTMTKGQAVNTVLKGFNVKDTSGRTYLPYKDVNTKTPYYKSILKAYNAGLITTDYTRNFNPNEKITKEELAKLLDKAMIYSDRKNLPENKTIFKGSFSYKAPKNYKYPKSYASVQKGLRNTKEVMYFDTKEMDYMQASKMLKEIFALKEANTYMIKSWSVSSTGQINVKYTDTVANVTKKKKEVEMKSKKVIRQVVKPTYTDFEKVKAIHDYLVLNNQYDIVNYNKGKVPYDSYSAYGALMKKISVCDGYTKAMISMLNIMGIENNYVIGTANGGSHSWNMVKVDGKFYHIDTTWDDPTPNVAGRVRYDYFLIPDSKISKDHSWDRNNYNKAASSKYAKK